MLGVDVALGLAVVLLEGVRDLVLEVAGETVDDQDVEGDVVAI